MKRLILLLLTLSCSLHGVEEVSPTEDLMREHGLLNRILLIYENIISRIDTFQTFPVQAVEKSAKLVKSFIEEYHEKLEEEHIFPRLEKANRLVELVKTLKEQHNAGKKLTDYIINHATDQELKNAPALKRLRDTMQEFITMYRPHEAREDTILFPEFKKIVSTKEYNELGDIFEDKEHQLFGKKGFEKIVEDVEAIEKELGIYNLSQYTPKN